MRHAAKLRYTVAGLILLSIAGCSTREGQQRLKRKEAGDSLNIKFVGIDGGAITCDFKFRNDSIDLLDVKLQLQARFPDGPGTPTEIYWGIWKRGETRIINIYRGGGREAFTLKGTATDKYGPVAIDETWFENR